MARETISLLLNQFDFGGTDVNIFHISKIFSSLKFLSNKLKHLSSVFSATYLESGLKICWVKVSPESEAEL